MSFPPVEPDTIRANLKVARDKRDRLWTEFQTAAAEVEWWEHGLRLFNASDASEVTADRLLDDLLPDMNQRPIQPTLRQAIILMLRANPTDAWTVDDVSKMLELNGWLPSTDPAKRVSDMLGVMYGDKILHRPERGVYLLRDDIAAALTRRLPPITDYRRAQEYGISVPDHIPPGPGLREA